MRALLDTCVVSEIVRPKGDRRVRSLVALLSPSEVYLSVITIGEITKGVALLRGGKKRDRYALLLQQLEESYGDRILPIANETAGIWGTVDATSRKAGQIISATDGLIAATAIQHDLHVITRNVRDFENTGALVVNPWEG